MQDQQNSPADYKDIDVIVAGAGHNGLVASCYLAKAGLKTLVVEAHETAGGMTATNPMAPEAPDHMINEASIHASLFRLSPIAQELELETKYGLRQRRIDPCHVQLSQDGDESIGMWNDPRRTAEEIKYFSKKDAAAWMDLSNTIDRAMKIGLPLMNTNAHRPSPAAVLRTMGGAIRHARHIPAIVKLMTNSHAAALEEMFESDMVRACLLTGLPFMEFRSDLSSFCMIYLAALQSQGITMFEGGTGAFPKALIRCLEDHGGSVRTGAKIEEIIIKDGRAAGVRIAGGEEIFAKKGVVTAFSPKMVLNHLLPEGLLDHKTAVTAKHIPTASRGIADFKLNIALKGRIEPRRHSEWRRKRGWDADLRLPTLQWATYEQGIKAYEDCQRGEIPEIIAGLGQVTTAFDPSMAPEGHDTYWFWSGLVPFKPNIGWEKARDQISDMITKDSAKYYEGIEELEIARRPLAPPDIEKRFHAIDGSVYHVDPYVTRFGPGRPAFSLGGYKTPVPGLFLSGSGTHPSAGICGMPGRNSAMTAIKNMK
ncbi:phytoene desaturase family protein [Zhongshania marina]|uniref:Pyridine nucleotide-disulfide oxidoreductase domain-containing protein 2 n=1 Tax=Zhongshania marina TaxID=2304603 RepID=A0A2S4HCB3_9GAMM|nr:NAD(P)/FAD-dependent oxidoreductase [Marortus luteolus]POP51642.1 dehydrogenase [Marortus luteolus]RNL59445.1 NAD(P)/FAD-dependent oxidoreductase [Zhongshania marina]